MSTNTHEVKGDPKDKELRRGEGVIWSVDVSQWATAPTAEDITIIREEDSEDVTNLFVTTATPVVDGNNIILPKVLVPTDAVLGYYNLNLPFLAGGFQPGIPFLRFYVKL